MGKIEPLVNGSRAEWPDEVGGISIFISVSKTDWVNQGAARSDRAISFPMVRITTTYARFEN